MRPGCCKGKAHRAENLGYAGRRVLVWRNWSGKTLADHRGDRKAWLLDMLGLRLHGVRQAHAACPRRPRPMAGRADRGQTKSPGGYWRPSGHWEGSVMMAGPRSKVERLLTVAEVAELLGTSERFPRRLIAERRTRFVKLGQHVRIPESAVREFIDVGRVDPLTVADTWRRLTGVV
jgi:excisionase family DNA binding protein